MGGCEVGTVEKSSQNTEFEMFMMSKSTDNGPEFHYKALI